MIGQVERDFIPALRFKAFTRFYDPVVRLTTRERRVKRALIEHARVPDGATVIDLGCGTGTLTIGLKRRYPGARVIGLDADPDILEYAKKKARAADVDVEFVLGNATDLPFDNELAKRVVSSLFFHHLQPPDKKLALSEAMRVLGVGGELHISDWGAPANPLMRALFFPVRLLDGFSNTRQHVAGLLPSLLREAGVQQVDQHSSYNTMFGTLRLLRTTK
ncbi:MAG: class I SAM-dependent methyltransferase [Gammaproteobacteria bacterium]|nr:class I SAM-dependent methyltransferase [Gammaproteobacteria bacterium]